MTIAGECLTVLGGCGAVFDPKDMPFGGLIYQCPKCGSTSINVGELLEEDT